MASIVEQTPFNEYTGNGVTTAFGFEFQLLDNGDFVASIDGVEIPSSDYTLSSLTQAGGTCTFDTAPANGAAVLLQRVIALARDTDYQYNGDLREETLDRDLNRLWQALQGQAAGLGGALRLPYPEQAGELPAAADRAGKTLSFHPTTGDVMLNVPADGTAASLAMQLASTASAADGAGMVFANQLLEYAAGSLGARYREVVSVKDYPFGAKGNFLQDDTAAINAAFAACFSSTPTVSFGGIDYHVATRSIYFPAGFYRVTNTIGPAGFGATKKFVGLSIFHDGAMPIYAGGNTDLNPGPVTIIADPTLTWPADTRVVDLRHGQYSTLSRIAVKGQYGATKGVDFSNGVGWGTDSISLYQHKYGSYHDQSSGTHYRNPGISNCSHVGLYLKDSGDSDIDAPFINTINQDYATDANQGIGIYVATSNNTNIRGRKIEYCSIGAYINNSQGVNVTGVQFDCNAQCHILVAYDSSAGLTPNALQLKSINIVGNRFLAGGHAVGTLPKSHINLFCGSSPANFVITGNSFRKGSGLAFDENTGGAQPVGPGVYGIYLDHQGDDTYTATVACDGNDLWNGSVINGVGVNAPNGANVKFIGKNVSNLPNAINAGTNVFLFDATNLIAPNTASPAAIGIMVRDVIANYAAGTMTLTLPAATDIGRRINIRTLNAQTVVSASANVAPRGSLTYGTAILPATAGAWVEIAADGTGWQVMAGS